MTDYVAGGLTTAGSTTLPLVALVGSASVRPRITEIHMYNTTATAVALKLVRLTTAGTPGSTLTSDQIDDAAPVASVGLLKNTYSSTGPTITDLGYRCVLGAAIGSGVIWTWPDAKPLVVGVAANAGIGLVVENGTGQAIQTTWCWTE